MIKSLENQFAANNSPSGGSIVLLLPWFHLHAPDGTGAGLDRVHSAATRRGKHREDHANGGSHRQHHHQGHGAGQREGRQLATTAVASSWVAWRLISVQPTGP